MILQEMVLPKTVLPKATRLMAHLVVEKPKVPEKVGLTRAGLTVHQTMADLMRTRRQKAIQPKALPRTARQKVRQAKASRLMVKLEKEVTPKVVLWMAG